MSELFNDAFGKVFTKESLKDIPEAKWAVSGKGDLGLGDISFDEETVLQKLRKLRDDKAVNLYQMIGRWLMWFRYTKEEAEMWLVIRPISLTSQLCKIFETLVRDQVIEVSESNQLIKDSQHGFRKGSSCLTSLLTFLDKVLHSVSGGYPVDVVFLDLAKAFDKVPHQRLLEKLKKHGTAGKLLSVIGDWLSNRKQRVCIKGRWSSWISVWSGVPQGSVLGPLLFLIFTNDLDEDINSHILKFARYSRKLGTVQIVGIYHVDVTTAIIVRPNFHSFIHCKYNAVLH